jgi:hypothetical protein
VRVPMPTRIRQKTTQTIAMEQQNSGHGTHSTTQYAFEY